MKNLDHIVLQAAEQAQSEPRCACGDSFTSDAVCANCVAAQPPAQQQAEPVARDVLMAFGVDVLVESGSSMRESDLAAIADRYAAQQPAVAVPDEQPQTGREKWTVGEWCEHFGGRHKDENQMNYYEFGSVWAIAKMLDSFAVTQRRVGWNACRAAMLAAAQKGGA